MLFNLTYQAIKICCPFSRSVRHVSVLSALVLSFGIQKTKVIFAEFGLHTTVLMELRIFWNAFAAPIGAIRIFPKCR